MYPHIIRLRGPWEYSGAGEQVRRVTVPCDLEAGRASLLVRKFGYPGRIDAHEHVWLTLAEIDGRAALTLNGKPLGEASNAPWEMDVTALLAPRNRLEIGVEGKRLGEVAMEVRASAFLQGITATRLGPDILVEGKVIGACDGPLELYFISDGRHIHYQAITAGESFRVPVREAGSRIRIELIHVSTVWYVVDVAVPPKC